MVYVSARSVLPPELDPRGTPPRRRRRPRALRLVNLLALSLSLLVLFASVGGYVVVKWFDGSIARIHLNLGQDRPADAAKGTQNWLLVGTDSGDGANGAFGVRSGERSDTTILAHLDKDGTTTNVSFPRDTLVTIPEYTDDKGVAHPPHKAKFNEAISDGGPSLLVRTVEQMTGIRVDHYVSVDLEGFAKISEALNGVRVCILHSDYTDPGDSAITNINDGYSGFHGVDGEQTVVGNQALAFVRQRHGLPNGDIDRIKRQQQFLGSVFRTATKVNLLFNPIAVARLLDAIKNSLTLDQNTNLTDLEKLGLRLRGVDPSKILFETIPQRGLEFSDTNLGDVTPYLGQTGGIPTLTPKGQTDNVGSVQVLEQGPFDAMIAKLKDQAPPTPKPAPKASKAPTIKVTVPPSQVLVTVENGVGRSGLAGQVTQALAQGGFRTGAAAMAPNENYQTSEVHYAPGDKNSAVTVSAAIPGSVLKEDPTLTSGGVVLIVGANYTSVQPVSLSSAAAVTPVTPTPAATASPAAAPVSAASAGNSCTY